MALEFANGLRLPIIVLGYDERKLFSVSDIKKKCSIPVFSDAEYARNYQAYFQKHHKLDIMTFLVAQYDRAINLFEVIQLIDPMVTHVAVDPMPPTIENAQEMVLAYELDEYIMRLRTCEGRLKDEKRKKH